MIAVISWWAYVLRYEARELWRALPGPWWVKVLLIVLTQAIPGPQDEIALLLLIMAALRKRRARIAAAQALALAGGA
jgi:hypothetical protein